jgi:hypothetical protein
MVPQTLNITGTQWCRVQLSTTNAHRAFADGACVRIRPAARSQVQRFPQRKMPLQNYLFNNTCGHPHLYATGAKHGVLSTGRTHQHLCALGPLPHSRGLTPSTIEAKQRALQVSNRGLFCAADERVVMVGDALQLVCVWHHFNLSGMTRRCAVV